MGAVKDITFDMQKFTSRAISNIEYVGNEMIFVDKNFILHKNNISEQTIKKCNLRNFRDQTIDVAHITVEKDNIYLTCGAPFIMVLDYKTLKIKQYIYLDSCVIFAPIVFGEQIIVTDKSENIYLVNLEDLSKEMIYVNYESFDHPISYKTFIKKIGETQFVICLSSGIMFAYDVEKKEKIWTNKESYNLFGVNMDELIAESVFLHLEILKDYILVQTINDILLLNKETGEIVYKKQSVNYITEQVVEDENNIYILSEDLKLVIIAKNDFSFQERDILNDNTKDRVYRERADMFKSLLGSQYSKYEKICAGLFLEKNELYIPTELGVVFIYDILKGEFGFYYLDEIRNCVTYVRNLNNIFCFI